eukprot:Em0022g793a
MNHPFSDRIEDYDILERLGEGGFAVVHKAKCKTNGEEVAIKIINIKKMRDKGLLDHVKREAHIHYRLSNPSILKMYNIIEDKHNVYLILELCHHGSLSSYLKRTGRKLTELEAKRVFAQVVSGVLYLHKHRIMHRDLSPSNLLVTKSMDIKISDFGLAVMLEDVGERHFTMCGTPNYIAPEIATQVPHGLESDVWSLGCLLYTLLVGHPPFDTPHARDTLQKVAHADQITIPSNISREAQDLIMGLMKKHPSERLEVSQILNHPFMGASSAPPRVITSVRYPLSRVSADSGNSTMASTRASGPLKATYRPEVTSPHASARVPRPSSLEPGDASRRSRSLERARSTPSSDKENRLSRHSSLDTVHLSTVEVDERSRKFDSLLPPLGNTARLRPLQKHTSSLIITITDTKKVSLQTLHPERGYDEVMEVSSDGTEVNILRGTKSKSDAIPTLHKQSSYLLKDLPAIYWKKYRFLAEFVEKLCAQTPKVTLYSEHARNVLMENDAFVARFYTGRDVHLSSGRSHATEEGSHELQHAKKALAECRKLEEAIVALEAAHSPLLPVCAGKRGSPLALEGRHSAVHGSTAHPCGPSCVGSRATRGGERSLCSLCPPLCTVRLSSVQKRVKNKRVISITESKKVLLQTLDPAGNIQEAMEISGNGLDVVMLRPLKSHHPQLVHTQPDHMEFYQHHVFTYHSLPHHYWSKYQFAAQFVEVLRSSTAKVTLYTELAKNALMENENFEACFYNGNKVSLSPGRIHFITLDGSTSTVGEVEDIPEPLMGYYRHADQALRQCRRIESDLGTYLPITVGCSATLTDTCKTGRSGTEKPLDGVPHVQGSSGCGPQGGSTACAPLEGLSGLQWSSVQCAGQPHCLEGSATQAHAGGASCSKESVHSTHRVGSTAVY